MGPNYSEDLNQKIDKAIKDSSGDKGVPKSSGYPG
jgi:hypothetical protein